MPRPASDTLKPGIAHRDDAGRGSVARRPRWIPWGRLALVGVVVGLFALLGVWAGPSIPAAEAWLEGLGFWGPALFVVIYVLLACVFFPSNALAFAAGTMFGFWRGYPALVVALVLAEVAQFVIARYLARGRIERVLARHPKLSRIDDAVSSRGLRLMFLLRLAPIPFAPLSYALAVSRVRFVPYLLASVGTWLSSIEPVYYGVVAAHVMKLAGRTQSKGPMHDMLLGGGVVLAGLASVYVTHVARRALESPLPEAGRERNGAG